MVERTCIVCRQKIEQKKMIRLVVDNQGLVIVQKDKKLNGRGAYICKKNECADALEKSKALNKLFKKNISKVNLDNIVKNLKS